MKDRRVRNIKIRIAERRQDPQVMLKEMKLMRRKPPLRVTPAGRKPSS